MQKNIRLKVCNRRCEASAKPSLIREAEQSGLKLQIFRGMARAFALGAQPRTASVVYPQTIPRRLKLTEIASECNISHSK